MTSAKPETFPANRDEYSRRHGSEHFGTLLWRKTCGRLQRSLPFSGLRLGFASLMGVRVARPPGERPAWIAADVYLDDTFPELITIGSGVVLAVRSMVLCHDDAKRQVAPVTIRKGCYIGAGALILPGVTVGEGSVIGAGAVVTKDVPAGETWAGVPARSV